MDIVSITMTVTATVALLRDPIFGSNAGVAFGRDLMWSNRLGSWDRTERAAFIVDRGNGEMECVVWPPTYQRERATFDGVIPAGTVAIIHTHPANVPWVSEDDIHESVRLGIPIYALTPLNVTKAVPSGKQPLLVQHGRWLDPPPPGHPCKQL